MHKHHARAEQLDQALADSKGGPVAQGSVGSGIGMTRHDSKGGIGSASRLAADEADTESRTGSGSIIIVAATDARLIAPECTARAKRATLGRARTGGVGERNSGDFSLAFSTSRDRPDPEDECLRVATRLDGRLLAATWP